MTTKKQYITTLELIMVVGMVFLAGVITAVLTSNVRHEQAPKPQLHEIVEQCEMDGVTKCEVVRVYDGETLVKFYMRSMRAE